jgi:hypothetical protein
MFCSVKASGYSFSSSTELTNLATAAAVVAFFFLLEDLVY